MNFLGLPLKGAFIIEPEKKCDERGFFVRTWCSKEFSEHSLSANLVQCSISYNIKKGTLRGMHYQISPYEEVKLVRCTRGSIYDVIIDLRPDSDTFTKWYAVILNSNNNKMIYIPEGFAHGFLTMENETEVFYQMSEFFYPELSKGVRWNDPLFNISWPKVENLIISQKDREWKDFII